MIDVLLPQPALGQCAREYRIECGVSVNDMAHRANVTRQTIHNFESGKSQTFKVLKAYLALGGGNDGNDN